MKRPQLLLAEDHALVGEGLRAMLSGHYHVVAIVPRGDEVMEAVLHHAPDVLLLDLSLPNRTGMDVLPEVRRRAPKVHVIIVSMHLERVMVDMALKLGARGYVPKDAGIGELRTAIEEVLAGRQYVSPKIPPRSHRGGESDPLGFERLTPRQQDIVKLMGTGKTTEEIADALGVSPHTVNYHRKNIRKELGVQNDWEMTRYAMLVALSLEALEEEPPSPPPTSPSRVGPTSPGDC